MQSTIITKNIHSYYVEVELDPEIEWSDCWIVKDGFSASLACLESTGELMDSVGNTIEVSPHTIEVISKWAESKGY